MVVGSRLTDDDLDRIFHALSDRTRRELLVRASSGECSVSQLARHLPMSFAAVQKHVAVLEHAGLVTKQRSGRSQLVHTNAAALAKAIALLDQYEQAWIDRAHQIGELLGPSEGDRL